MNSQSGKIYEFIVASHEAGIRLDIYLSRKDLGLSRSQIKKSVDDRLVRVNHADAKVSCRLKCGDIVHIRKRAPTACHALPQDIPLTIVYEDTSIIVVDKPAGMVVHPAAGHSQNTLVNAILHHCKDLSGIGGVLRPGIVHRLDKETSGLLVVAKSDEAHRGLAGQFKRHEVRKTYKALVYGNPKADEGVIDEPVGRHPVDRKKMSTRSRRSKEALTRWQVFERYGVATLLNVEIVTGRTHQIRVHVTALGYPVVGDSLYGNPKRANAIDNTLLRAKLKAMKRQALHAAQIGFVHPITGQEMIFSSPLPDDMIELVDFLKKEYNR
ncbi:MAG: RluA family pseudouridine synthase [Deltaproteobacteria bacterium]|nr:RluA family pseudouridine synthase [Deltaproteobacteria bacterium]